VGPKIQFSTSYILYELRMYKVNWIITSEDSTILAISQYDHRVFRQEIHLIYLGIAPVAANLSTPSAAALELLWASKGAHVAWLKLKIVYFPS